MQNDELITLSHGALESSTVNAMFGMLPMGIETPSGIVSSYTFRPPKMGVQKRLGEIKARRDLIKRPGRLIAYFLGAALASLNGEDMSILDEDEAALRVARLPVGDVFYLLYAHYAMSNRRGFRLDGFACGSCGAGFDAIRVDVGGIEVTRIPPGQDRHPTARIELFEGFPFRGETATSVTVRPPVWVDTFWSLSASQFNNAAIISASIIKGGIVEVNGQHQTVTAEELDELWPEDASLIEDALGLITPSTDQVVEIVCPTCGSKQHTDVPWQDLAFG